MLSPEGDMEWYKRVVHSFTTCPGRVPIVFNFANVEMPVERHESSSVASSASGSGHALREGFCASVSHPIVHSQSLLSSIVA